MDESRKKGETVKCIVIRCSKTKTIFAHVVPCKGLDEDSYVTAVHAGGAAAVEGTIEVGDLITEVNGKDTSLDSAVSLLPRDKERPIKLRLVRYVAVKL